MDPMFICQIYFTGTCLLDKIFTGKLLNPLFIVYHNACVIHLSLYLSTHLLFGILISPSLHVSFRYTLL